MELLSKTLNIIAITLFVSLITCSNAHAWGAGIHIMEGSCVLKNLHLIIPLIAEPLRAFPNDYLYGCISADIFIGKGSKRRDDHCHNWSTAMKMLDVAESPSHFSFAYGYLSHLCADIIAHNFYIPNQLYLTASTKKLGHLYWEYRSDSYIKKKYWNLANKIISRQNYDNDEFMQKFFKSKIIPFQTKKKLYSQSIKLGDLEQWQDMVSLISRNSRWNLSESYVLSLHLLSLNLIFDFLNYLEDSVCLNYDPVGSENLRIAKKKRTTLRKTGKQKPVEKIFMIPDEIVEISQESYGVRVQPLI